MLERLMTTAAATGLGVAVCVGTASAGDIKWDMPNEYQATSIHGEGDRWFSKFLKDTTGGEIEIVHHFGGALGYKSAQQLDAVGDGAVPIADSYVGAFGGIDPIFLLPSLPFLARTTKEARTLFEVARPHFERVFAKHDQILLYASPWPPSGIWAKQPVDNIGALKNLKIRTYDRNGTITLKAAGAAAVKLSWADVVPQLGTGGIQAVLTSAEGGVNAKFWEHLDHFTEINYAMPLSMVHMNKDVFDGLPDNLKKAVKASADAANDRNWREVVTRQRVNYKTLEKNGVTVVTRVPPAYLTTLGKAGREALDDWYGKMGGDGEAIMAEYRKRLESG